MSLTSNFIRMESRDAITPCTAFNGSLTKLPLNIKLSMSNHERQEQNNFILDFWLGMCYSLQNHMFILHCLWITCVCRFDNYDKITYGGVSTSNEGATTAGHIYRWPSYHRGVKFLPRNEKKTNSQLWRNSAISFSHLDVVSVWVITVTPPI